MVNKLRVTHESGAIVGSNDHLLTEILRRLPFTSVFRFKSVSKHWHSLLSHRTFTLLYDNVPVSPGLFLHDLYIPFDLKNPSPLQPRDRLQ
ncbi:putative F-box domain-containing protein [Helianthus anomalus]